MSSPVPAADGDVPLVWRPGDVILDLYEVREVVEGGGMGLVYRVHHRGWAMDLALSAGRDTTARVWELDWDHEFPAPANWDEGARSHLDTFLTLHRGAAGRPSWTEEDFELLLQTLGDAGLGWLKPHGVRAELERMTR